MSGGCFFFKLSSFIKQNCRITMLHKLIVDFIDQTTLNVKWEPFIFSFSLDATFAANSLQCAFSET